jgi:cytochrome c oxidase cbb3-type subunit 4
MDLNDIRSLVTLFSFVFFIALMAWTYRPSRRSGLDEAAQLPFSGEAGFADEGARDE